MKIDKPFLLRNIAGELLLVPVGESVETLNGIITVNELGAFLWRQLQKEQSEETLLQAVLEEYDAEPEQARRDIAAFLQILRENGLLSEA